MADWLCDVVTGAIEGRTHQGSTHSVPSPSRHSIVYPLLGHNKHANPSSSSRIAHTRTTIHPSPSPIPEGFETAGMGRLVTFSEQQPLTTLLDHISRGFGNPGALSIAVPQSQTLDSIAISTVGVCPGSGAGVLMKAGPSGPPGLLLTGELSHHDALAAIERGSVVITLFHSNTERGYLHDVMQRKLTDGLQQSWETQKKKGTDEQWGDFRVDVSERDRDPYGIVVLR
jgi:putative NIF3 family GTP cyclohydrolase 1 type 2